MGIDGLDFEGLGGVNDGKDIYWWWRSPEVARSSRSMVTAARRSALFMYSNSRHVMTTLARLDCTTVTPRNRPFYQQRYSTSQTKRGSCHSDNMYADLESSSLRKD